MSKIELKNLDGVPYHKRPLYRYKQQMKNALKRGIEWQFTFDEWIQLWEESGKWNEMGNKKGQYCMARHNDEGPYSVNNVSIITTEENHREAVNSTRKHTMINNQINCHRWKKGNTAWHTKNGKTDEHMKMMQQKRFRPVTVNGQEFESIKEASEYFDVSRTTASRWAHNNKNGWRLK